MDKVKVTVIAVMSALMSWMGILAIPVGLLILCNIIDYITGLVAAGYRADGGISSYKSMRGIAKKVGMWLLVVIGAVIDALINYAAEYIGHGITVPFVVATIVAVWLIVNEIISVLENIIDIGVTVPPFLLPLVKKIKSQVESKAGTEMSQDDTGTSEEREE